VPGAVGGYGSAGMDPGARDDPFDLDSVMTRPSDTGRFGEFGGRFVPETLVPACMELEEAFVEAWTDPSFRDELATILRDYAGRPSMLTECFRLSAELGVRVFLKREDLNHTGSHKINNVLGQALLAKRMGKARLVAETGAGQHGVATATAAALMGLSCKVYMGAVDVERQALNVFRMRLLGADVEAVESGSRTLKDAVNEAMRDWVATVGDTHYCLGSVMGPHPYPWMVRQFHRVIGDEARQQIHAATGRDPDVVVACVGGGSNAIGLFSGFVDTEARLVGVEPAGGAAVRHGVPGVVHGMRSYLMQNEFGQVEEALSISAGLDYPGVGPEHSYLSSIGRAEYPNVTDAEVIDAFQLLSRTEGIIPALESAHAIAWLAREAGTIAGQTVIVNLSGRGDKDVAQMMDILRSGDSRA
jgi:tryptophan synthase beta chain